VADYPFTTLTPQLGVVQLPDFRSFVLADIPGIIEGAHEGKGLGHQFLQHIERTRTLAILVPADDPAPQETYDRLRAELARYSAALAERPHCLLLTKTDLLGPSPGPLAVEAPEAWGAFPVSSVTGDGIAPALEGLWGRARGAASEFASHPEGGAPSRLEAHREVLSLEEESAEESWWRSTDQDL
jgi:GTP-binding protein